MPGALSLDPAGGYYHPTRKGHHPVQLKSPRGRRYFHTSRNQYRWEVEGRGSKGATPFAGRSRDQEVPGESLVTFFSQESHPGWRGGAPSPWVWGLNGPHFGGAQRRATALLAKGPGCPTHPSVENKGEAQRERSTLANYSGSASASRAANSCASIGTISALPAWRTRIRRILLPARFLSCRQALLSAGTLPP